MSTEFLLNEKMVEKMTLAKQLGRVLLASDVGKTDPRAEEAAALLATDPSRHVREVLAHTVRRCSTLPTGLIEKIATDEEAVASGFLVETPALSETEWLHLIPQLKDANMSYIACRPDVTDAMQNLMTRIGGLRSVTTLVRNDAIRMSEAACDVVISRFSEDIRIMDHLSARADLTPETVHNLMSKVSTGAYKTLADQYGVNLEKLTSSLDRASTVWAEIAGADRVKVEDAVCRLHRSSSLTDELIADIGERGGKNFFEIALSHRAALPVDRVREMLSLERSSQFVQLIRMARVADGLGPRFLQVAKRHFTVPADQRVSKKSAPRAASFAHAAVIY